MKNVMRNLFIDESALSGFFPSSAGEKWKVTTYHNIPCVDIHRNTIDASERGIHSSYYLAENISPQLLSWPGPRRFHMLDIAFWLIKRLRLWLPLWLRLRLWLWLWFAWFLCCHHYLLV